MGLVALQRDCALMAATVHEVIAQYNGPFLKQVLANNRKASATAVAAVAHLQNRLLALDAKLAQGLGQQLQVLLLDSKRH